MSCELKVRGEGLGGKGKGWFRDVWVLSTLTPSPLDPTSPRFDKVMKTGLPCE